MQGLKDGVIENAIKLLSEEVERPEIAIVLGSGVTACDSLFDEKSFEYQKLFGIAPTVHGHKGSLTIGKLQNMKTAPNVAVFRGRFHLYEGHGWLTVTLLARLVAGWEIPNFIITNAAGGLNRNYNVGDLMVLNSYRDHLNPKLQETGLLPALSTPAVNVSNSLSKKILESGQALAREDSSFRPLQCGCYAALLGPSYETHAEIEMLRRLNADAVGMSTAPELETVKGTKTTAAGISVITNVWNEEIELGGHEEVLQESKAASQRLDKLLLKTIQKL